MTRRRAKSETHSHPDRSGAGPIIQLTPTGDGRPLYKVLARILVRQAIEEAQGKRTVEPVVQAETAPIEVTDRASRRVSKLEIMSAEELAQYLRIPVATIIAHAETGTMPKRRIGLQYYFSRRAVIAWIEKGNVP